MRELELKLISNDKIAEKSYRAWFQCDDEGFFDEFKPGQFLQIKIPNSPHLILRRPIAVEECDKTNKRFSICYFLVGQGTQLFSALKPGETVVATGPIGNGFDTSDYRNIWILGGGLGAAPLYSVVQQNIGKNYTVFLGFSSASYVYDVDKFEKFSKLTVCTDDGSLGKSGFSIDVMMNALKNVDEKPDAIFACGNTSMLKALKQKMLDHPDIPCFVSLESRMGCGIGTCLVCNCKIQKKNEQAMYKRVCVDGPVFPVNEVIFDEQ